MKTTLERTVRRTLGAFTLLFLLLGGALLTRHPNETKASVGNYSTSASTYYSGISTSLSGTSLALALHNLMLSTHKTYTTYTDVGNYTIHTDTDPNNASNIICIYTGASVPGVWDSGVTWNREHVWCQSLSNGLYGTSGAGADLHHLRPSIPNINSLRNNRLYADLNHTGTSVVYSGAATGCYYDSNDHFEPRDAVKGDIARILMYVYVHYTTDYGGSTNSYTGDLNITNILYTSAGTDASAWATLLAWNQEDPVDGFEERQNEQVAVYQGNRNPFIDNPSYADAIWGGGGQNTSSSDPTSTSETSSSSSTPSEKTLVSLAVEGNAPACPFGTTSYVPSGVSVIANYSDGTTSDVTSFASFASPSSKSLGVQTLGVTYGGMSATYTVKVTNVGSSQGSSYTGSTTTYTAVNSAFPSGWTSSGLTDTYKDGSAKFDSTGDYAYDASVWGSSGLSGVSSFSVDLAMIQNGGASSSTPNVFSFYLIDATQSSLASFTLTGGTTALGGVTCFLTTKHTYSFVLSGLNPATTYYGIKLQYTLKDTGNFGVSSVSVTPTFSSLFTDQDQAGAWATYFVSCTDGDCAESDVWANLEQEYGSMSSSAKTYFVSHEADAYSSMMARYDFAVRQHGLNDFIAGVTSSQKTLAAASDDPLPLFGLIVMAGAALVFGLSFIRKRARSEQSHDA